MIFWLLNCSLISKGLFEKVGGNIMNHQVKKRSHQERVETDMHYDAISEFRCDYAQVLERVSTIQVEKYSANRNFIDGDVTRLSPFITHGIISTRHLAGQALEQDDQQKPQKSTEKFIFQLAWRDFFHRIWLEEGDDIFENLSHSQLDYGHVRGQMPIAIINATTGIHVVDDALQKLYSTGYIHNHERMWLAFIVANLAKTDWRIAAKWMHYHLLDGDLASNALSWQWVAGTFSQKQYIANQDNLNKYTKNVQRHQQNTFLDVSYDALATLNTPEVLNERVDWYVESACDVEQQTLDFSQDEQFFVRSLYHLDPTWHAGEDGQHVIIIEPRLMDRFPISAHRWAFIQHWVDQISAINKKPVIIVNAYFNDVFRHLPDKTSVIHQSHQSSLEWQCENMVVESYPWLFPELDTAYPSFFKFWRHAQKYVHQTEWQESLMKNIAPHHHQRQEEEVNDAA